MVCSRLFGFDYAYEEYFTGVFVVKIVNTFVSRYDNGLYWNNERAGEELRERLWGRILYPVGRG
jgi:hypothetical protein